MSKKPEVKEDRTTRGHEPADAEASISMLVRFWLEPRESRADQPVVRGYCRNLKTGEEAYLKAPRALTEHLQRELESARKKSDAETEAAPMSREANN